MSTKSISERVSQFNMFKDYIRERFIDQFVLFFPILIIISLLTVRVKIDMIVIIAIIANYLMSVSSFLYNDMEDREDDANTPTKKFINPFGYKIWSLKLGYILLAIIGIISIILSYIIGGFVLAFIAITNLLVGYLYSLKNLRLKSMPVFDVLSHSYLLGGATIIYFIFLPGAVIDYITITMTIALFIASFGSDFLHEYHDFDDDKNAGLNNSASYIGKKPSLYLSVVLISIAVILGVVTILSVIF